MLSRRNILKSIPFVGAFIFGAKSLFAKNKTTVCGICKKDTLAFYDCIYAQRKTGGKLTLFRECFVCKNCTAIGSHRMPVADTKAFTADGLIWTDNYWYFPNSFYALEKENYGRCGICGNDKLKPSAGEYGNMLYKDETVLFKTICTCAVCFATKIKTLDFDAINTKGRPYTKEIWTHL